MIVTHGTRVPGRSSPRSPGHVVLDSRRRPHDHSRIPASHTRTWGPRPRGLCSRRVQRAARGDPRPSGLHADTDPFPPRHTPDPLAHPGGHAGADAASNCHDGRFRPAPAPAGRTPDVGLPLRRNDADRNPRRRILDGLRGGRRLRRAGRMASSPRPTGGLLDRRNRGDQRDVCALRARRRLPTAAEGVRRVLSPRVLRGRGLR